LLWDEPKIFFLERRYFFSIILSEFLKNRVALQKWRRFAAPHQKHTHIFWHWKVKIGSRLHRPSCLAAAV
jgi:hypothetical protein